MRTRRSSLDLLAAGILAVALAHCTDPPGPLPEEARERLSAPPAAAPVDTPVDANLPLPPSALERLLRDADFEIREVEDSSSAFANGASRVFRVEAYFAAIERTLALKWKAAPEGGESRNNTPRREIAAYAIQKWFLSEAEYVVPPTSALCIPMRRYAPIDANARPNLPDVDCVFGTAAVWLERVDPPDPLYDEQEFLRDPRYARHLGHYNLLMHLIDNRDTRAANVMVSTDPANRRVFSIDNGITFGEPIYNILRRHWHVIRVPALPASAIERLRRVDDAQLDALALVAEFRTGRDRVLREVRPSAPFDAERGLRLRDGVLQLGLEPDEIRGLRERLRALLADVDAERVATF